MKRKNLKSLKLNRKSISNFESTIVKGGDTATACLSAYYCGQLVMSIIYHCYYD